MRMTTVLFVHRDFVGRDIPFDKLYFFHKDDAQDIPRVFPNGYVLPINKRLSEAVTGVLEESKRRGDTHRVYSPSPMRSEYELRFKGRGYDRLDDKQQEQKNKDSEQEIIRILDNRADYLALVPVLFTKQRPRMREKEKRKSSRKMVYPQYLTALKWRKGDTPEELIGKMVGARAYFIYRGEVYRPLCLLCPHSIDSVVGDCKFGTKGCYFNLGRIGESDFTRGVKAYRKLAEEIDEPELNLKEDS